MIGLRRNRHRAHSTGADITAAAGRLPATKATWAGLAVVGLGWAAQIVGGSFGAPGPLGAAGLPQCLILTGFGLAILAALHNGFGALNRFFETVAQRSAAAASRAPAPPPSAPIVTVPERPNPNRVKGRGRLADRTYMQYADGSVEVETLLGSRRFDSFEEAREFIGG